MSNEEFLCIINSDPDGVRASEDGSYRFQPISVTERKLDEIFGAEWSWDFQRESFGRGYVTGKGVLSFRHPVSGQWITRSGTAAISLTKSIEMDYPKLESAAILNAAKKIGPVFGRNLNRDRDDAEPLPVVQVEASDDLNEELANEMVKISLIKFKEEAEEYIKAPYPFRYNPAIKKMVASKPNKPD